MPAYIANAFYSPVRNQMVFPTGILQPPCYAPGRAFAVDVGALGMLVGHEMTHAFDDQGALFAASGAMEMWWTDTDLERFRGRGACLAEQYAGYEPVPGTRLDGELTLGEAIADLGGVRLACRAYHDLRPAPGPPAGGLTDVQQFFVSVAQVWCAKVRDAEARALAKTDTRAPARFRILRTLSNLPEFADAFACERGTPLAPRRTCEVW